MDNTVKYEKGTFTFKDLEELCSRMNEIERSRDHRITLPACSYEGWSDKKFISLISSGMFKFIGGSKGVKEMQERMDKLGIK